MRRKDEKVNLDGLQPHVRHALHRVEGVLEAFMEENAELVITSARDQHEGKPHSLHNVGLAVDIRTKFLSREAQAQLAARILAELGDKEWDVVAETSRPHIHIEYDPK